METALWTAVGLLALVLAFQLYQWIEVGSAKRDMMRAHADCYRMGFDPHKLSNAPPPRTPAPPAASPKKRARKRRT